MNEGGTQLWEMVALVFRWWCSFEILHQICYPAAAAIHDGEPLLSETLKTLTDAISVGRHHPRTWTYHPPKGGGLINRHDVVP